MIAKVILIILITFLFFGPGYISADLGINIKNPLCLNQGPNCINNPQSLLATIKNYIIIVLGSISTVLFVYAGFLFLVSAGKEETLKKARQAVTWAVVGLALAAAAEMLLKIIEAVLEVEKI